MESPDCDLEQALCVRPDSVHGYPEGPRRFNIEGNLMRRDGWLALRRRLSWLMWGFPYMQALRQDIAQTFTTLVENPADPKTTITAEHLRSFEAQAYSNEIGAIGYTDLPLEAIFQEKAVLFTHVIVLVMEMDADKIAQAPSPATFRMVMKSYYDLGQAVEHLVEYLRQHGYAAQGGHPLNGVALYPLIAQRAGLGQLGANGLLIAPQFGPRHRLAAIYTSISNLPDTATDEHTWVSTFCGWCRQCHRKCPGQAIYDEPIRRPLGIVSHVNVERCFPVFADQYGCSICIKVCPFNLHPYEQIRDRFAERAAKLEVTA
jgi:epoxyqueuosine reductase